MRTILFFLLLAPGSVFAQSRIAQFVVWQPNKGQEASFEKGYIKHLDWHKANGDTWSWYAWFFLTGPRNGQFIDATVDHPWSDFDHSVKPAEDGPDADLHVAPYGEVKGIDRVSCITALTTADAASLQSRLLRWITVEVSDLREAEKLLAAWEHDHPAKNIRVFKPVDGGPLKRLNIWLTFADMAGYGKSEKLVEELQAYDAASKTFLSVSSETLIFQPAMSWIH
jgi:hypothetical protein